MTGKILLLMLASKIFLYILPVLPEATSAPKCSELASSKKLQKAFEGPGEPALRALQRHCSVKLSTALSLQELQQLQYEHSQHNSEQTPNALCRIHSLLCHHSLSNTTKSQVVGVLPLKSSIGGCDSAHHTSCSVTARRKRCLFTAQRLLSC